MKLQKKKKYFNKNYSNKKYFNKSIPTKNTSTKTVLTKCTSTNLYILPALLLITIALLIAFSIYLTKHQSKQKHLEIKRN